jgi:hypothetical protein
LGGSLIAAVDGVLNGEEEVFVCQENIGAAAENEDVGLEEFSVFLLFFLIGEFFIDQAEGEFFGLTHSGDEFGGLDDFLEVDIDGFWKDGGVGMKNQHLSGLNEHGFANAVGQGDAESAFENDDLDEIVWKILDHDGGASDGSGHGCRGDLGAASSFGNLQEHGALLELGIPGAGGKGELGVGTEAGNGAVGKDEFGAGFLTGHDSLIAADDFVELGGCGCGVGGENVDLVDDGGDLGGLEGLSLGKGFGNEREGKGEKGQSHEIHQRFVSEKS